MSFKRLEDDLNIIKNITGSADNNYGLTEEQMKSKFDEAAIKIQNHVNEHIDELEAEGAARSIGYDGALGGDSHTVAEALDKLEQSGIGNIPPSNTITTDKIVNSAVTQEKLSESLNNRLDYLYSNLSKILIQNGAQGEIEGSEDLLLFGLNGELEEVYNLAEEKTSKWLDNYGKPTDNQTFTHTILDAESTLNTNDVYNITDEYTVHNTKLAEIKNAVLNLTTNNLSVANSKYTTTDVFIAYLEENYYAVATLCDPQTKMFVIKYNENSKELTIVHEATYTRYDGSGYFQVTNNIAYWCTRESTVREMVRLTKDGIVTGGTFETTSWAGFANGSGIFVEKYSDSRKVYLTEFEGLRRTLYTAKNCGVNPVSGYWAAIRAQDAYCLYNVESGVTKTITQEEYETYADVMRSADLDAFYLNGYRYTIDNAGNITKHEFIENYVKGYYTYKISDNEEIVYSGAKDSSIYKIARRENKNAICIELFNTSTITAEVQSANPNISSIHYTFNPNSNVLLFGIETGLVRVCELTKGTIKLATPITNALNGAVKVSREQKCTVPANQVKQIFIRPETEGNTYNAINLIVYLDRALASGDELKVEIIDASGNKTQLTMLDSSTATTKYYSHSYGAATADIQAIATIKAGATEMKATQILGGVDNAI